MLPQIIKFDEKNEFVAYIMFFTQKNSSKNVANEVSGLHISGVSSADNFYN